MSASAPLPASPMAGKGGSSRHPAIGRATVSATTTSARRARMADRDSRWHEPVPGEAAHHGANEPDAPGIGDGDGDPAVDAARSGAVASETATGQATSASGGYGSGSAGESVNAEAPEGRGPVPDAPTSGGAGEGDTRSSTAGEDPQTDWLRNVSDAGSSQR